jgi:hypothetical protein
LLSALLGGGFLVMGIGEGRGGLIMPAFLSFTLIATVLAYTWNYYKQKLDELKGYLSQLTEL